MNFSETRIASDFFKLSFWQSRDPRLTSVDDAHRDLVGEVAKPREHRTLGPSEAAHHAVKRGLAAEFKI